MRFSAPNPSTVQPGNPFTLSWTSTGVTTCTASGGSGSDGWNGIEPVNGSVTLTAPATPGSYNYTLTCAGSAAVAAATATETVSGSASGVPIFTGAFTITPPVAGSSQFSWSVSGATSCVAVGGSGSDGWSGTQPAVSPSGGVKVTAPTNPGVYTYALICYGSAGSTAQTATITIPGTPAGDLPAFSAPFTATPSAVSNATPFKLSWASDATSCAAVGGDGSSAWSGVQPASAPSGGVSVTAPSANGAWTYLLGCNGAGGTVIKQVTVTVGGVDCGVPGIPTRALLAPHAGVTSATGGALCLICSVSNQQNVIDQDPGNFATIQTDLALLSATESLTVVNDSPYPAGRTAGFVLATPAQLLTLDLLQNLSVSTYLKGALQETGSAQASAPLRLDLLQIGLIGTSSASYLSFATHKDFDAVQVTDGPLVGVLGTVNVYKACVSTQ